MFPLRRTILLLALALAPAAAHAQESPAAPAPEERVYTRDEVTKPAVIISMPEPAFKKKLGKLLDMNGTVKVAVVLAASGRVTDAQILEGLSQAQNFAALKAARRTTFMPATKDGLPVSQSIVAEYHFKFVTDEFGTAAELKGVSKFYVDAGGDAAALGDITGEIERLLPEVGIVDSPEQAECRLIFYSYGRTDQPPPGYDKYSGRVAYNAPQKVSVGRGWVVRPLSADRQRVLMYYEDTKASFVERRPSKNFARAFVNEYKRANGIK